MSENSVKTRSRSRLFMENMLVYGLGGILGKLVPFLMLPVVTRLMPGTSYFGLSDLSNTLVSFAQSVAIMGMYDAMFRMFFEESSDDYKKAVCSTALFFVTGCSLVVAVALFLLQDPIARVFFGGAEFSSLVVVSAASVFIGGNNSIVQAPTRMQNRRATFIVMNLATSVLSYSVAIPMLLAGEYLLALPIASAIASATALIVFFVLNRKWFGFGHGSWPLLWEMLKIGVPLMPTFIFYWVFHSADRLMVLNLLGASEAGVYAVAAKMGQASQLIYTAFAQGWQYFAFSTMKDRDQVALNSRVYEYLGVVSFLVTGFLLIVLRPLYSLLFPEQYASGVISVPYLFLSPLLLMLYQIAANQLLVIKKTWPSLVMLSIGALVNVGLNLVLIPAIGIEGAAIATLAGYITANLVALTLLSQMRLLKVNRRFFAFTGAFAVFVIAWRVSLVGNILMITVCWLLLVIVAAFIYQVELSKLVARLHGIVHSQA